MGFRPRLHGGRLYCGGTGIGPRIREDNGWGVDSRFRRHWGQAFCGGDGDGSPHPRGQREGMDSRFRLHGGQALCGGTGMGPRIREDNGWGWIPASRGGRFETCPYGAKQVILVEGTGAHKGLPYGKKGH